MFLQAIQGAQFAASLEIPFFVDFGNLSYPYSEPLKFNNDPNFWNYFFIQKPLPPKKKSILNSKFENYPLKVWSKSFTIKLNQTYTSLFQPKQELQSAFDEITKLFSDNSILGVHYRKTDHFNEVTPVNENKIFQLIDRKLPAFDRLFLATDDQDVIQDFEKKYADKLFYHPCTRSSGNQAIHSQKLQNGFDLGKEALLDCFALSQCKHAILSPSNLSFSTLVFNPYLSYSLAESKQAKWKRLKTLLLYYLDVLGIRKW